jgi:TPR repeat protein
MSRLSLVLLGVFICVTITGLTINEDLQQRADSGDLAAQFELGLCYYNDPGQDSLSVEALHWFRLAADQGDARSQRYLGLCYNNGVGGQINLREAVKWYLLAANQNDPTAQYYLGLCYFNGEGVVKQYPEAYFWFLVAAANGERSAEISKQQTESHLTPETLVKVLARADEWLKEKN